MHREHLNPVAIGFEVDGGAGGLVGTGAVADEGQGEGVRLGATGIWGGDEHKAVGLQPGLLQDALQLKQ